MIDWSQVQILVGPTFSGRLSYCRQPIYLLELREPALIKMDAEGYELEALKSASEVLIRVLFWQLKSKQLIHKASKSYIKPGSSKRATLQIQGTLNFAMLATALKHFLFVTLTPLTKEPVRLSNAANAPGPYRSYGISTSHAIQC